MLTDWLHGAALLLSAWLFGGMLLFAAGFAAFLFKVLPIDEARALIRKAFPPFYLFVIASSALAALAAFAAAATASTGTTGQTDALLLALIALTTVPARQVLMPAINRATDRGERRRFAMLHGLSVLVTMAHIVIAAVVIVRLSS